MCQSAGLLYAGPLNHRTRLSSNILSMMIC